jgi:hypothetical protein
VVSSEEYISPSSCVRPDRCIVNFERSFQGDSDRACLALARLAFFDIGSFYDYFYSFSHKPLFEQMWNETACVICDRPDRFPNAHSCRHLIDDPASDNREVVPGLFQLR